MAFITSEKTNLFQNEPNFILSENQPIIFKRGYFTKVLDPSQEDKTKPRTVTIKCLQKNCK